MKMQTYQDWAQIGASYPAFNGLRIGYSSLALANEAGEVAGAVKKCFRDDTGVITSERREKIKEELGDVLWYLSNAAMDLGFTLDEIAEGNITKLAERHGRQRPIED